MTKYASGHIYLFYRKLKLMRREPGIIAYHKGVRYPSSANSALTAKEYMGTLDHTGPAVKACIRGSTTLCLG